MIITPSQAGSLLHRHAAEIASLRLSALCQDVDRVTSMVAVHNSPSDDEEDRLLLVDFSRQKMTLDTINHLLRLSVALQLRERIRDLAWGRLASGIAQKTQQSYANRFYQNDNDGLLSPTVSFAQDTNDKARSFHDHSVDGPAEMGGSMHLSLRMPSNQGMYVLCPYSSGQKPKSALDEIHNEWKRIRSLSSSIRQGNIRGSSGSPLCDVLVVSGSGTVVSAALTFVYRALLQDDSAHEASLVNSSLVTPDSTSSSNSSAVPTKNNVEAILQNIVKTPFKSGSKTDGPSHAFSNLPLRKRKLRVLTSVDSTAWAEATSDLCPATTCVITLAVDDTKDEECKHLTLLVRSWLQNGVEGGASDVTRKQMYLVTNQERIKKSNPNNSFLIPRHSTCEAFLSFSAAGLLPLSVVFGWDIVASFLSGAHSLDGHFVETNPRHNLAVLLGLVDVWNDVFLNSHGRVIAPYLQALGSYPAFVSVLENNVLNGRQVGTSPDWNSSKNKGTCCPSSVIDGGPHSRYHYSQGEDALSTEFVTALDPIQTSHGGDGNGGVTMDATRIDNNDERVCSMFTRADTLAFGSGEIFKQNVPNGNIGLLSPSSPPAIQSCDSMLSVGSGINGPGGSNVSMLLGNRPSTLIICGRCDAFACGQLLALAEHRVLVKAWLWNIDPFELSKPVLGVDSLKDGLNQMYQDLSIHGTLEEDDEDDANAGDSDVNQMNASTRTILKHYATRMHKYKNNASGRHT
eukprot:CCRYP_012577-RA/>CCRYP_012577-RA protein AED:0.08 eAED:0.08 QI:166/1/1/1/1/1/2/57/740